ncbi:MAG: glycosyltransferase family 4 protein [Ferruginibacter sp.]|nr:glycosyltransferase family 4 protein [Ferruginibacter sp.]
MRIEVMFLTLKVFSSTGGIEKVCRIAGKAILENCTRYNKRLKIYSMYDKPEDAADNPYFPTEIFTGFNVRKLSFIRKVLVQGRKSKIVILSHVNLLLVGWLIKKLKPSVKIVLIAHGIEIWDPLSKRRKKMLNCCDEIISVSKFTRNKILEVQEVDPYKCTVLNNCLDPFLPLPKNVAGSAELRKRYGFNESDKIMFTLTRLAATERYKGYDKVMEALVQINNPRVKYLIAGSYDAAEKIYIDALIKSLQLEGRVVLAGFIQEEEVAAHFTMSDCYVMPSIKEGFGIVFIEAMYYNLPVIAGNADGSVDALQNGELGILVNPDSVDEIKNAIESVLKNRNSFLPDQEMLAAHFSYESYKIKLNALFSRLQAWKFEN